MILTDNQDALVVRHSVNPNHQLSLLSRIYVEKGSKEDWDLLHELHYKAETLGIGPKFWKITLDGQTIGVGVMTVPKMLISGRNELFKWLRPNVDGKDNRLINRHRAVWLNKNACTNSRLVIDTMFRGAGIAYRAQNLMMRMTGLKLIEFQSSMSKFNPFAEKAGIIFAPPKKSNCYEKGLVLFRRWFNSFPTDYIGIMQEFNEMSEPMQQKFINELKHFYYTYSSMEKTGDNRMNGTSRIDSLSFGKLLKNVQQLAFSSPLYGVYINPDATSDKNIDLELPNRLPLTAFDLQGTNAPLNLKELENELST